MVKIFSIFVAFLENMNFNVYNPSFSALIILGRDFIYNKLETWIFSGDYFGAARGADQLRKEFEDKYFSECPNNLEKPKIGKLGGKL